MRVLDETEIGIYRQRMEEAVGESSDVLERALTQVRGLRDQFQAIYPRAQQMVSLASDGGHSRIELNPFNLFIVRVVDSNSVEIMSDVVAPRMDTVELSRQQFNAAGAPRTPLGQMMIDLGASKLSELTPMIDDQPETNGWVVVYRDLCEWAALYQRLVYDTPTAPTVYLKDGLLRTKIFKDELFIRMYERLLAAIERWREERRVEIALAGVAKRTEIVEHYEMAMAVVGGLPSGYPAYAAVPKEMQEEVYVWPEYIREPDDLRPDAENPKFNIGAMHFVRFGPGEGDKIWTVDVLHEQRDKAEDVIAAMTADAESGFPIPYYPLSLQKADEFAQIAGFDREVLGDLMTDAVRDLLPEDRNFVLDALALDTEITARRYG